MKDENMKSDYQLAPGRGLMNQTAFELRMNHLKTLVELEDELEAKSIRLDQIQNNIESYIGTVEIPLGLIGPLAFVQNDGIEMVYTAVATTEGALAASMNRGAKAISECGGFQAHILHQKMLRTPMFTFSKMSEAITFDHWIKQHFKEIKEVTSSYSNYAELIEIKSVVIGKISHLKFIYSTSDASGQNMTTSCTWHACLWIDEHFQRESNIEIVHFIIDGNGASDKKVSHYSMQNGRGTHVVSECFLSNEIIEKTLRTTAEDMFRSYNHSMAISRLDGMIGYNINVANSIAGIFASTGQDLACIHESSTGILQMEKFNDGLYVSLSLTNLVVGTVGGGTHLPVFSKILELMGCKGPNKVGRFAKLISGFALSLEISTLAAIVSGQFVRAHQKLGRNKPVNWLLKSEIDLSFITAGMSRVSGKIDSFSFQHDSNLDNGILMDLTSRVSKKVIGFIEVDLKLTDGSTLPVLMKSKALGTEVMDGLRFMASNLNVQLSDTLFEHREFLEYAHCEVKEIEVYSALSDLKCSFIPAFYGSTIDEKREIHLFFMERLDASKMTLFNSENHPDAWTVEAKLKVINAIHSIHRLFSSEEMKKRVSAVQIFDPLKGIELYRQFTQLNGKDYEGRDLENEFQYMEAVLRDWNPSKKANFTLVHTDFNPRNVALRSDGNPCFYDWELATLNIPQRDVFEFLAFTFEADFSMEELRTILRQHYDMMLEINDSSYSFSDYIDDFIVSGDEFLLTRVNFYLAGSTLVHYPFIVRVLKNAVRMITSIKTW
ncbi:MAG: phosphotransferase [Flavobacteriales bacterium]